MQAYRFALDLTPGQQRAVLAHAGAARVAHNWALAQVKASLGQRAAERSYGISEAELTPAVGWSLPALRRAWNQAKAEVAPWWAECSKECTACGLVQDRDLNAARNLAALAATVAGSGSETLTGRGADRKTPLAGRVAVKRLPGTATAGKTGTAAPQGAAA